MYNMCLCCFASHSLYMLWSCERDIAMCSNNSYLTQTDDGNSNHTSKSNNNNRTTTTTPTTTINDNNNNNYYYYYYYHNNSNSIKAIPALQAPEHRGPGGLSEAYKRGRIKKDQI